MAIVVFKIVTTNWVTPDLLRSVVMCLHITIKQSPNKLVMSARFFEHLLDQLPIDRQSVEEDSPDCLDLQKHTVILTCHL